MKPSVRFDMAMGQKSAFKADKTGTYVKRYTFPQFPGTHIKNPKVLETKRGPLLLDGLWGVVRKPSTFNSASSLLYFRSIWKKLNFVQITRPIQSKHGVGLSQQGSDRRFHTFTRSFIWRCYSIGTREIMQGVRENMEKIG
jgi:hypothetical protein